MDDTSVIEMDDGGKLDGEKEITLDVNAYPTHPDVENPEADNGRRRSVTGTNVNQVKCMPSTYDQGQVHQTQDGHVSKLRTKLRTIKEPINEDLDDDDNLFSFGSEKINRHSCSSVDSSIGEDDKCSISSLTNMTDCHITGDKKSIHNGPTRSCDKGITPESNTIDGNILLGSCNTNSLKYCHGRECKVSTRFLKTKRTQKENDNREVKFNPIAEKTSKNHCSEGQNINKDQSASPGQVDDLYVSGMGFEYDSWKTEKVSMLHWGKAETEESIKAFADFARLPRGNGIDTIFLIDTSASMRGEGMRQCQEAFQAIMEEIERGALFSKENVGIVTFGAETRILQYPTCVYGKVRHCLDNIVCEKTSPLFAGFVMCAVVQKATRGRRTYHGNWTIGPRIILISDGQITDHMYINGPDDPIYYDTDSDIARIQQHVSFFGIKTFCVPVGNSNMEILETVAAFTNGKVVNINDVRTELGRYAVNVTIASHMSLTMNGVGFSDISDVQIEHFVYNVLTAEEAPRRTDKDVKAIETMLRNVKEFQHAGKQTFMSRCCLSNNEILDMPPLGSRVRRGPDWNWGNQDLGSAGTVTCHHRKGWLHVVWDNGQANVYRFGAENAIDVLMVNEPRILRKGEKAVLGCLVERGPDWKWDNQDGGAGNRGSIYRESKDGVVYVRWPDGHKSNYRFGRDGKHDVQICSECLHIEGERKSDDGEKQNGKPETTTSGKSTLSSECHGLHHQWQWKDSTDRWRFYSKETNDSIEKIYKKNPKSSALVEIDGVSYRVVMWRNIQINTVTKEKTDIRRKIP